MADETLTGTPDTGGSAAPAASPTPSAISFSDDTEFIPPGSDKPVKYKDFLGGYVPKSELTRMRQHDRTQIESERKALKDQEAHVQRAAREIANRLGPQTPQTADIYAQLEALPYMDGKTGASVVRQIAGAIAQRDQALGLLHNRLQQLEKGYGTLSGQSRQAEVSGLFSQVRTGLGLPDNPQVAGLIESEYHAHQGWDTVSAQERVEHLKQIVQERVNGLKSLFQAEQKQRVDAARSASPASRMTALKVPRPKGRIPGSETPQELAEALFPMIAGAPNT